MGVPVGTGLLPVLRVDGRICRFWISRSAARPCD